MKKLDIAFLIVIAAVLGFGAGIKFMECALQREAIQNGVGRYNPTNAIFQWGPLPR